MRIHRAITKYEQRVQVDSLIPASPFFLLFAHYTGRKETFFKYQYVILGEGVRHSHDISFCLIIDILK